jgi:hypothetical protein
MPLILCGILKIIKGNDHLEKKEPQYITDAQHIEALY